MRDLLFFLAFLRIVVKYLKIENAHTRMVYIKDLSRLCGVASIFASAATRSSRCQSRCGDETISAYSSFSFSPFYPLGKRAISPFSRLGSITYTNIRTLVYIIYITMIIHI